MKDDAPLNIIARMRTDFPSKFGIPRQSGLVPELVSTLIFEPEYRNASALRGIEGFSHLWIIWKFSEAKKDLWSPTVRPPRLGGNKRLGVFATRSPYRPNPIAISCVKIESVTETEKYGTVITVSGADMLDNTPIYDIKPYIPYTDSVPSALGGFAEENFGVKLSVNVPEKLASRMPSRKFSALIKVLEQDPRPAYQDDSEREYGFDFSGFTVKFKVCGEQLTVTDICETE